MELNDRVRIQHEESKRWNRKGKIIAISPHRSYEIQLENGRKIWRNRKFIRKDRSTYHVTDEERRVRFEGTHTLEGSNMELSRGIIKETKEVKIEDGKIRRSESLSKKKRINVCEDEE